MAYPYDDEEADPLTIDAAPRPTGTVIQQANLQAAPDSAPTPTVDVSAFARGTPAQAPQDLATTAPQNRVQDIADNFSAYSRQTVPEPVIPHQRMVDPEAEQQVQERDQKRAVIQQAQDQRDEDKRAASVLRGLKQAGVEIDTDPLTGEQSPKTDDQGRVLYKPRVIDHFHEDDNGDMFSIKQDAYGQVHQIPLVPKVDPTTGEKYVISADGVTKKDLGPDETWIAKKDMAQAGEVASLAQRRTDDVRGQIIDLKSKAKDLRSKLDVLNLDDNPTSQQRVAIQNARSDLQAATAQQAALADQHDQLSRASSAVHDEWIQKRQVVADLAQAEYAKRNPGGAIALAKGQLPVATTPPAEVVPDAPPGFEDVTSSPTFKAAKEGDKENMLRQWVNDQVAYRAQTDPTWSKEKETQFRGEHPDRPGVTGWISELGHGIYSAIADQFPEDIAKIARGDNVSLHGNAWYDRVIDEQEADKRARPQSIQVSAGAPVSSALATGAAAVPISMALGAVGGAVGKPVGTALGALAGIETGPGALATGAIGGALGSGAVSGAAFYRMAKGDFLQQVRDKLVAQGTPITDDQWNTIKGQVDATAQKAGMWQAGPAALSQALTMGLFNGAGKALAGKALAGIIGKETAESLASNAVLGIAAKYGGTMAEQIGTMTATQQGLHNVEADAGLTDEPHRDWDLAGLKKSAGEIVGPVLVQALLQGGLMHVVEAEKEHAADSKLAGQWNKDNAGVEGYMPVTGKAAPAIRAAASLAMDEGMQKQWAQHTEDVTRASKAVQDARDAGDTAGADAALASLQEVQAKQPALQQALRDRRAAATDAVTEAANAAPTDRVPVMAALKSAAGQELTRQEATALVQTRDAAGDPIATRDGATGVKMTDTAADTLRAKFPATAKLIDLSRPAKPEASAQPTTRANAATNANPPPLPTDAERAAGNGGVHPPKEEAQDQNEVGAGHDGGHGSGRELAPPPELTAAQPRYTAGKQFSLHFASDVDKAAYLSNHPGDPAKRAVFARHAMDAGGMTAQEVAAHGGKVRDAINAEAAKPEAGPVLTVLDQRATERPSPSTNRESGSPSRAESGEPTPPGKSSERSPKPEVQESSPHPAPARPEPQADPLARTKIVYRDAKREDFTPEQRNAIDEVGREFARNRALFKQFGVEGIQPARAEGEASGIATSEGKLSVDGEKLLEQQAIVKQRGGDPKQWVRRALIEEIVHQATIKGLGPKWKSKLEAAWRDSAMSDEMRAEVAKQAAEKYDGFENLDDHQKAAELVRMVVQGEWKGTITEQVFNLIRDLHAYLTGLKVGHSPLLQEAITQTKAALDEARTRVAQERREARAKPAPETETAPDATETAPGDTAAGDQSPPARDTRPAAERSGDPLADHTTTPPAEESATPAPETKGSGSEEQGGSSSAEAATTAPEAQSEPEKPESLGASKAKPDEERGGPVEVGHALIDKDTPIVTDIADAKGHPDAESAVLVDKDGVHHYDLTGEKPVLIATSKATGDKEAIAVLTDAAIPKVRNLDEIDREDFPDATKALVIRPNTGRMELVDIASEEPIASARLESAEDSSLAAAKAKTAAQKEAERLAKLRETRAGFAAEQEAGKPKDWRDAKAEEVKSIIAGFEHDPTKPAHRYSPLVPAHLDEGSAPSEFIHALVDAGFRYEESSGGSHYIQAKGTDGEWRNIVRLADHPPGLGADSGVMFIRKNNVGYPRETGYDAAMRWREKAAPAAPEPHVLTKPEGRSAINAYHHLARTTGFPAVSIADLADQSGVPLDRLKQQLLRSQKAGSVVLSTGDWSLASDKQRAGVIEDKGQKMLQVRFLKESGDLAAARTKSPAEKKAIEELPKIADVARARVAQKANDLRAEAEKIRGELNGDTSETIRNEVSQIAQSRANGRRRAQEIEPKLREMAINGPAGREALKQHVVAAIKRANEPLPAGVTVQPLKGAYISDYAGHNAELDSLSWNDEADAKAELASRGYKGRDADVIHKPFPNERYAAFRGDSVMRKDRLSTNADSREEAVQKYHIKQASTDPEALQRYATKYGIENGAPTERESELRKELAGIQESDAEAAKKIDELDARAKTVAEVEDRARAVQQEANSLDQMGRASSGALNPPPATRQRVNIARDFIGQLEHGKHLTAQEAGMAHGHLDELDSGAQADEYLALEEGRAATERAANLRAKQTAGARARAARVAEKSAIWSDLIDKKYGSVASKLARFWKGVGSDDEAFAFPKSDSRDPDLIARHMSIPGHEMTAEEKGNEITFKTPQGELSITGADTSKPEIYAASAGSKGKKQGGGSQLYQAALTWAHNNGKKIYPSNALTPINKFVRRTSNMLSSALRFGTTKHMTPDAEQGVKWKTGSDSYNIGHLALREMEQVFKAVPELQKLTFDFDTAKVQDADGKEVTPADLEQRLRDDKESTFDRGIGRSTAQRAIITASALRELDPGEAAPHGGSLEGRGSRISDEQGSVLYAAKANLDPLAGAPDPEQSAADKAHAEATVAAFGKLPKVERDVVNMRLAGKSDEEITKATGLSAVGVKRAYDQGLGRMNHFIEASTAATSRTVNRNTGVSTPRNPVTVDEATALRRELGQEQKASQQGKRAGIAEARAEMLPKIAELRGKLTDSVTKATAYSEGLKQAERAGEAGRAAGTVDTREQLAQADRWLTADMNRVKDDLVSFTNAMLPKEERGRFLPQIANALANRPGILNSDPTRPYRDAFKIMGKIQLKAEDVYRGKLQDEIRAASAKALASPTVDIHFKDAIRALTDRHQFAELTDKKRAQLEARRETIANTPAGAVHGFTGEDIAELRRLVLPHISELPTGAMEAMLGEIEALGAEGRSEVKGRKASWEADKAASAAALKGEVTTPFEKRALNQELAPLKPGQKTELTVGQRLQNTVRKVMDQAQVSLDRALMPVDALFDILGGAKGKYDGWLFRHVRNPLDLAHNERLFEEKQANDRLDAIIKKHGLTTGDSKRIAVFATDQQEGGRERLKAQGYTDARIDEISRSLTAGEREAYGEMRKTMDGELPHVQVTMRDLYNIDVPGVKDYFPMPRDWKLMAEGAERPTAVNDPTNGNLDELATWKNVVEDISAKNTTSVAKGFTKERVEGAKTAINLDAFNTYRQHMADVLHLKHSQALLKRMGEIMRTPLAQEKFGKAGRQEVLDWLDTVARNGGVEAFKRLPLLDGLRKLSSVGMIAFRLSSTFKHASNAALAVPHVGATWYMRGLANVFGNDAQAFLGRHFAETVNRSGGEQAIEELTKASKIAAAGFYGIRKIDQIDAQAAVLGHYMRSLAAKGIDPSSFASIPIDREAQGDALVRMRRVVASAAAKDTPQVLSRGRGLGGNVSVARSIFQFGNIFLDRWSNIRHDLVTGGVMKGETRQAALVTIGLLGAIAAESGIVMATHAANNAITGQHDNPDDNSRDFEHEALKHSMRQIPYLSQMLQAAMYKETGIPVIDAPLGVAGEIGQAAKVADPNKKLIHVVKAAGSAASILGVPGAGQATDLATGKMKVNDENAVQRIMRENQIHHNPAPTEGVLPRKDLVKALRENTMTPGDAYKQARKGGMGEKDAMRLVHDAAEDPALSSFKRLPYETAKVVFQKAIRDPGVPPKLRQQMFEVMQKKKVPHPAA